MPLNGPVLSCGLWSPSVARQPATSKSSRWEFPEVPLNGPVLSADTDPQPAPSSVVCAVFRPAAMAATMEQVRSVPVISSSANIHIRTALAVSQVARAAPLPPPFALGGRGFGLTAGDVLGCREFAAAHRCWQHWFRPALAATRAPTFEQRPVSVGARACSACCLPKRPTGCPDPVWLRCLARHQASVQTASPAPCQTHLRGQPLSHLCLSGCL